MSHDDERPLPERSADQGVRHEVAEEMLNWLRAVSAHRLADAERRPDTDPAVLARLRAEADRFVTLRRELFRKTPAEVEALIAEHGPQARVALEPTDGS